jgi:hypothetical protein
MPSTVVPAKVVSRGSAGEDDAVTSFVKAAQDAFSPVLDSQGITVTAVADDPWYAKVERERAGIRLSVSDDRRDNLTELFISRPLAATCSFMATGSKCRSGRSLQRAALIAARASRWEVPSEDLQQLGALATATGELAADLLVGEWRELDVLVAAVRSQHEAETDEGRRKRRYLP